MKRINVKVLGITPLMQHRFPADDLLQLIPGLKTEKKKNEEPRTPRQIAERHAYMVNDRFVVPGNFFTGALMCVSSDYKQKSSSKKSLKSIMGGAVSTEAEFIDLLDEKGKPVKDFEVDIRKATNHLKGAVAVCRPRFDRWSAEFILNVDDSVLPIQTLQEMLEDSGKRAGIGSFRVANRGPFGKFHVREFKELED